MLPLLYKVLVNRPKCSHLFESVSKFGVRVAVSGVTIGFTVTPIVMLQKR